MTWRSSTLPLVARLVRHFGARGVDVRTQVRVARRRRHRRLVGDEHRRRRGPRGLDRTGRWPIDDLLALAMNIEAQVIDVPTGAQDYRPALYGGVSAVELRRRWASAASASTST